MTATVTMHVGDVRDIQADLPDRGYDLLVTSPPFLALRSYLPADHPLKHRELGSEPTPATFLDTLYGLTADWGRLLPEWASICVELGDTMSGSGGAGGDYDPGGLREGQDRFEGSGYTARQDTKYPKVQRGDMPGGGITNLHGKVQGGGPGWPLAKSMCLTPHAYTIGLAYGRNPLTGQPHPAGQWRIRNVITWARPNPPVGSLGRRNPQKRTGDYKFRPACSYITVACRGTGRYFDLDAVRVEGSPNTHKRLAKGVESRPNDCKVPPNGSNRDTLAIVEGQSGAPPLDWHRDGIDGDGLFTLEQHQPPPHRRTVIRRNDPRRPLLSYITVACRGTGRYFDLDAVRSDGPTNPTPRAGIKEILNPDRGTNTNGTGDNPAGAPPLDWHTDQLDGDWLWKLATAPYPGAHYATYPLTLPRRLILAMCPESVCRVCGWPRERMTKNLNPLGFDSHKFGTNPARRYEIGRVPSAPSHDPQRTTLGFTDCRCPCSLHEIEACTICHNYRPGHVLDPFAGSGTTAVAAALEHRDCTLIDLDPRNVDLVHRRLADVCRIHDRTTDGDTTTWTVEPSSAKVLAAIAEGQLELW